LILEANGADIEAESKKRSRIQTKATSSLHHKAVPWSKGAGATSVAKREADNVRYFSTLALVLTPQVHPAIEEDQDRHFTCQASTAVVVARDFRFDRASAGEPSRIAGQTDYQNQGRAV